MRRIIMLILCVTLIILGGLSVYLYRDRQSKEDYKAGMFVDRGENNGYATMYDLLKGV